MPCTTLLVGKNATYDGSTFAARNEDSGSGHFSEKKMTLVEPSLQPKLYRSVLSHVTIPLPEEPLRYTAMPNAIDNEGIWAAAGVNSENISMTATETITSNERVLSADPLVVYDKQTNTPGGIGEEDMVTVTLPYIHSAREGVLRLGSLLEQYGTYEMNGIAFQDVNEVWWLETIGGHHWIARRVPDDSYVIAPNQFGIDYFDLNDAFGEQKEHLCSADLLTFIEENHLDLSLDGRFNARLAFGSHDDSDHTYNTPRAWAVQRYFNPHACVWDGPNADFTPESDDLPWCRKPEHKITVDEAKWALSNHFQTTPYDCYTKHASKDCGKYRYIGINRNNFLSLVQIRPYLPEQLRTLEWIAFGSNAFNAFVPVYSNVHTIPAYYDTKAVVSTDSFYWHNRLIGALADSHFSECASSVERYQNAVPIAALSLIYKAETAWKAEGFTVTTTELEKINAQIAAMVKEKTDTLLSQVLFESSMEMKNRFARSDA